MNTLKTCFLIVLLGATSAVAAGTYYALTAFSLQSSMGFAPLEAFVGAAGYRVFEAHSLPLPTFTSGSEAEGPPCFAAGGRPRQGLAAGSPCCLPVRLTGAPAPLACSTWKREVCNVVALPAELHRNQVFLATFQAYVDAPCRFGEDYRWLEQQVPPAAVSAARLRYYARVIDLDFRCAALEEDPASTLPSSDFWSRLKPHLLLENYGQADTLLEVRIRPPGARKG